MRRGRLLVILAVAVVLAAGIVQPLVELIAWSLEGEAAARFASLVTEPIHRRAIANSVVLAFLTVVVGALVGLTLALLTHRLGRAGTTLRAFALSPLLLPPVLGTIAFYFLFERGGLLPRLLGGADYEFRGFGAILVVHALTMFVYFLLFGAAALRRIDVGLTEAARTLGASPRHILRTVTLPLLRPAIAGAAALTFMSAMASFTAPYIFGKGERYLTTAIVIARQDDQNLAAALAVVLTGISLTAVFLLRRGDASPTASSARETRWRVSAPRLPGWLGRALPSAALVAVLLLPFVVLVLLSLKPRGQLGSEALLENLTMRHYETALHGVLQPSAAGPSADLLAAIGRSAVYALVATVLDVAVALALVLSTRRGPPAVRGVLEGIAMLPLAVPGTVIGIALIAAFIDHGPLGLGPPLVFTAAILPLAYFVRNLPILVRATAAGLSQLPPALPEAARTLGSGPLRTTWTVIVPFLLPSILGGAVLGFVTAIGEFVASILLYTPFTRPASVAIYEEFLSGYFGTAAAAGVLLALFTALALGTSRLVFKRQVGG